MTTLVDIQLEIDEDSSFVDGVLAKPSGEPQHAKERLVNFIEKLGRRFTGKISTHIDTATNYTKATATATCVSVISTDVLLIGSVTLTVVASASTEDEVTVGGSDTIMATNFAAKINAHSALKGVVTATSAAGVVTITSALPGRVGNQITCSSPDGTITVSAAALAGATVVEKTALVTHAFGK